MHTLDILKNDKELWRELEIVPAKCSFCNQTFEIKHGTLYNIIRREADGIYCSRKCSGAARARSTQEKFVSDGGKKCKRCDEFKSLENFSSLPNPPYYRSECKRCHNYKPARHYLIYKEKSSRQGMKFNLSMDDFLSFDGQPCNYCGEELKSIRLELLNNHNGYLLENLVSCCRSCQKFKNGLDHDEFISLCKKVLKIKNNVRNL